MKALYRFGVGCLVALCVVSILTTPAALLLLVNYAFTGDLASFETMTKITAAWTVLVCLVVLVGISAI